MSIIRRFSCVVLSFTRQSYSDFESIYKTSSKSILSTLSIVDLAKALILKPYAIA